MSLQNSKTILMYGFSKNDEKIVKGAGRQFNVDGFKIIKDHMTEMKIKDILSGDLEKELREQDTGYFLNEKVILFNNLTDRQISGIMRELKVKMNSMPILAVVTKTSINWSFGYLLSHLLQERAWFEKNKGIST
ncbi:DUF3783 domain-containing protein [Clostridium luticellarii]|uniref:DUF3783 domain-containing protein n=1 Tax=Clostridium luticellarii TaxID=1691940 RepID=A0A2T0BP68_9CLOT|nr:DUF3783 domain-containing protein [Clostridium luticellarii]MCI1944618.1 DUF3783 domain-containing protein [Clostridium luticellarii]MCI1968117.1 DUF3783 domain-containing protein [Clostridium luticellarii]MCI1994770.1 DUF3783 domain-containing protein [Clostridium luticellarii]MCI2039002.1 DUF3783 domain-containing protein [Clostridium luticellarii]PRR85622.1 hypothetical protein CLLU_13770 [Clostridium luticellarii]